MDTWNTATACTPTGTTAPTIWSAYTPRPLAARTEGTTESGVVCTK